jgi:hypothetical protein
MARRAARRSADDVGAPDDDPLECGLERREERDPEPAYLVGRQAHSRSGREPPREAYHWGMLPVVLVLLALASESSEAKTIRQIELRGNARIFALDVPVRKGRLYLFHRYPDGVFMSVPAEDVLGVAATTVAPVPKTPDTVMLGETGEGHPADQVAAPTAPHPMSYDMGYGGYYGYGYWPCFGCNVPPSPPASGPPPPSLVGPNGFPLLPGSPPPPPIGPNGFPILNPPPVASPR